MEPLSQPVDPAIFRRPEEKRKESDQRFNNYLSKKLSKLIPAVTLIFVASITSPNVRKSVLYQIPITLGIMTIIAIKLIIANKTQTHEPIEQVKKKYTKFVMKDVNYTCIVGPILEEIKFRGIFQSIIREGLKISLLSLTSLEPTKVALVAKIVSVISSSIYFSYSHKNNGYNRFRSQLIITTIHGIIWGSFFEMYGLKSAIGMHMVNNTLLVAYKLHEEISQK